MIMIKVVVEIVFNWLNKKDKKLIIGWEGNRFFRFKRGRGKRGGGDFFLDCESKVGMI